MARQSASDVGAHRCAELTSAVNLYTATDLRTVQGVLLALTIASVINALFSAAACLVPRRALARSIVCCLLVLPVAILVPFLVLNGRRDGMRIFCRFGISNESALSQALADCTNWTSASIDYNHNFDFSIPNSQSHWQLYLVLIFSGASTALAVRVAASMLCVRHLSNNNTSRRRPHFRGGDIVIPRTPAPEEVEALLTRLRIEKTQDLQYTYHEKQCAICLEDWSVSTQNITRLECAHTYHEICFAKWLQVAEVDTKCPLCKAPVWDAQNHPDMDSDIDTWDATNIPNVPAPSAIIISQEPAALQS